MTKGIIPVSIGPIIDLMKFWDLIRTQAMRLHAGLQGELLERLRVARGEILERLSVAC